MATDAGLHTIFIVTGDIEIQNIIITDILNDQLNDDGTPIVESEIINWVNSRLAEGEKEVSIRHFQDKVENTFFHFTVSSFSDQQN